MWDHVIDGLGDIFCEGAFVPSRLATGRPAFPFRLQYLPPFRAGFDRIGATLNALTLPTRGVGPIPALDLTTLGRADSLFDVLRFGVNGRLTGQAAAELSADGRYTPLSANAGLRERTDDLLGQYAVLWSGTDPPLPYAGERVRTQIHQAHRSHPRLFQELFARRPPADAAYDVELAVDVALDELEPERACDDLFRVRVCQELVDRTALLGLGPTLAVPGVPAAEMPAYKDLSELDRRFVHLFDGLLPRTTPSPLNGVPDPAGRLMLYLSYFGRVNAILIAEVLGRRPDRVVRVLAKLWREVLLAV